MIQECGLFGSCLYSCGFVFEFSVVRDRDVKEYVLYH